ncbi:MAG: antibiotic biosynthesis monooxygenase [Actinomycetota bacterium]|nr:antibiotic biosynthesis monooxygenase [Actinomycetota bacterium]
MAMPSEPLVLINAFEVAPDEDDEFIRGWEAARDYLQTQPGYVDTALHRSVSPDADRRFVNVGRWRSVEDFQAETQSPAVDVMQQLGRYRPHPGLYQVVRA